MKTKKVRDYYKEIDTALLSYENLKPYHDKQIDWICDRIVWCWKFRHITKDQMEQLVDRVCTILEMKIL